MENRLGPLAAPVQRGVTFMRLAMAGGSGTPNLVVWVGVGVGGSSSGAGELIAGDVGLTFMRSAIAGGSGTPNFVVWVGGGGGLFAGGGGGGLFSGGGGGKFGPTEGVISLKGRLPRN